MKPGRGAGLGPAGQDLLCRIWDLDRAGPAAQDLGGEIASSSSGGSEEGSAEASEGASDFVSRAWILVASALTRLAELTERSLRRVRASVLARRASRIAPCWSGERGIDELYRPGGDTLSVAALVSDATFARRRAAIGESCCMDEVGSILFGEIKWGVPM